MNTEQFDHYAADYDEALAHGISVSGEDKNYFAERRVAWLASCLRQLKDHAPCHSIMDLGCGTGSATPFFLELLGANCVLGVDTSFRSLEVAKQSWGCAQTQFRLLSEYEPREQSDVVFCNGVFHHIPVHERSATVDFIYRSLRSGGLFSLWDNNPWNPGARYVMRRIPFDRDAVMMSAKEGRHMLQRQGFRVLRVDFLFIFPRILRFLRCVEPLISRLPFGAQYQVLARKR